jgi:two-component system chemotaxis sensor kinase CheA
MDDMLKEFVVEALDLATNVEEHLLSLERRPDDTDSLNALFRSFHTIKGGAGFMNLPAIVSACHLTENLFDGLRTGKVPVTPTAIEAGLQASGFVADQLSQLANGAPPDSLPAMPAELEDILTAAIEGKADAPAAASAPAAAEPAAAPAAPVSAAPTESASTMAGDGLDWEAMYRAVVPAGTLPDAPPANVPAPAAAAAAPKPAAKPAAAAKPAGEDGGRPVIGQVKEDTIRIDAVKLDALLEVAGESVQAANQAAVLLEKLVQFKFEGQAAALMATLQETLSRASRYSTELQRATLSTRMQPVGRLFQKFPRLVRELAKDLNKEVELVRKPKWTASSSTASTTRWCTCCATRWTTASKPPRNAPPPPSRRRRPSCSRPGRKAPAS